jgi:hypothetical protein
MEIIYPIKNNYSMIEIMNNKSIKINIITRKCYWKINKLLKIISKNLFKWNKFRIKKLKRTNFNSFLKFNKKNNKKSHKILKNIMS